MKFLMQVEFEWQAQAIVERLKAQGIEARYERKSREYASIITGIGQGVFDILVDEAKEDEASRLIQSLESKPVLEINPRLENQSSQAPSLFKRTMLYSLLGLVIAPVVFQLAASTNFMKLLKIKGFHSLKAIAGTVLVLSWLLVMAAGLLVLRGI